jgi:hypothetical protein
MKVINLDKFSSTKQIVIGGKQYELKVYSVGDYIGGKYDNLATATGDDPKDSMSAVVDFVEEFTNIPRETILTFGMDMLTAISTLIQGGDVDADEKADGGQGNA